ncbi:hypothetical protein IW262DRAFT_1398117 [Armillaria fumosa]|nr:hypothetical protein IW262DRAFT_1398117 [Armillaria fumosa]
MASLVGPITISVVVSVAPDAVLTLSGLLDSGGADSDDSVATGLGSLRLTTDTLDCSLKNNKCQDVLYLCRMLPGTTSGVELDIQYSTLPLGPVSI